jgi:hypothetical protein
MFPQHERLLERAVDALEIIANNVPPRFIGTAVGTLNTSLIKRITVGKDEHGWAVVVWMVGDVDVTHVVIHETSEAAAHGVRDDLIGVSR